MWLAGWYTWIATMLIDWLDGARRSVHMHCHMLVMLIDWLDVTCRSVHMRCHNVDWLIDWLLGCGSQAAHVHCHMLVMLSEWLDVVPRLVHIHCHMLIDWLYVARRSVHVHCHGQRERRVQPRQLLCHRREGRLPDQAGGSERLFFLILKIIFTVFKRCFFLIFKTYLKILFFDFWCIQGQFLTVSYNPIGRKIILFFVWHYSHIHLQ